MQRIGDVLLATPLVRSIKAQWPQAQIDLIVFRGTEGVLEHNPDVRQVIAVARRATWRERFADAARIWRRYDLACATISSSRCRFYAWAAGRKRVGLLDPDRNGQLSALMLHRLAIDDHRSVHTVTSNLALTQLIGVSPRADVVAPGIGNDPARRVAFDARFASTLGTPAVRSLAVLHPFPMYVYKQWRIDGWTQVIAWLRDQGFAVALSGGQAPAERAYAMRVVEAAGEPVLNLVGQLTLGETAEMIRRAKVFIGPDTGVTHIASGCGTPTVALFGPSNPIRWGPWPSHWPVGDEPWALRGSGRRGNVFLLQGGGACVPCKQEGCERHVDSESRCLTELDASRVIAAVAELLGLPKPHRQPMPMPMPQPQLQPGGARWAPLPYVARRK
jgi:heptosyltransferase-3